MSFAEYEESMLAGEKRQLRNFITVDICLLSQETVWSKISIESSKGQEPGNTGTAMIQKKKKKKGTGANKQKRDRLSGITKNAVKTEDSVLVTLKDWISMPTECFSSSLQHLR